MKNSILCEPLKVDEKEFLLASIVNDKGCIGVCRTSGSKKTKNDSFFIGSEALISMAVSDTGDDYADKMIWQTSSIDKCKNIINSRFSACVDNYFMQNGDLQRSVRPILEMLTSGLYVIHVEKMIPTDGCSGFFWNSFAVKHEFPCSSTLLRNIGTERNYVPCFLVPTENYGNYSESRMQISKEKAKAGFRLGGIAYHLTGMYSALLEGHINALISLSAGADFYCILIEPVTNVKIENGVAVSLYCPYVSIPINSMPRTMMENFLLNRRLSFPDNFSEINAKSGKVMKNLSRPHYLSDALVKKVEQQPDCEMIATTYFIKELTDEQIDALLRGETKIEENTIISANLYESLVSACNYLHYTDMKRFVRFATEVIRNPDFSATHKFVAGKLQYIIKSEIYGLFVEIASSEDSVYAPLKELAEKYISVYEEKAAAKNSGIAAPEEDFTERKMYSSEVLAMEIEKNRKR